MDDDNKICQVYDFTSIKKSIDDKKNTYTEVSQEEWEHCVYIFFYLCVKMVLWEKEERQVFRSLTRQYKQEGYNLKEAKKLAKIETKEIMSDKKAFAIELYEGALNDFD